MKLTNQLIALVVAVVIAVSLFAGLLVISDNGPAATVHPTPAIRPPIVMMSQQVMVSS